MKLVSELKKNILELIEILQREKIKENDPWSDTKLSMLCFGYGDFIGSLRKWSGGKGGPTLAKIQQLETFIRDQIGEEKYQEFLASLKAPDDFND